MIFGRALVEGTPVLVTSLGSRWLNLTRASRDYHRHVEGRETAPLDGIPDMLAAGLFNRSFYRRIAEFVQRNNRLADYALPSPPELLLPWRPGKVIAVGRNYAAHVAEFDNQLPKEPVIFCKANSSCIGTGEAITFPESIGRVDHEGELGVVIGKRASRVRREDARAYVAGYTLANDVTARDMQRAAMAESNPWFVSKSMDTFCPIGPVVALADALPWPVVTPIEVRVNGETRQKSDTGRFIFSIPEVLEAVTRHITLEPGDLVITGTPEGVSPLKDGDLVEVMNPELGVLANPVRALKS